MVFSNDHVGDDSSVAGKGTHACLCMPADLFNANSEISKLLKYVEFDDNTIFNSKLLHTFWVR